jgi:cellulose/xylan binding protein with CBM9 domain
MVSRLYLAVGIACALVYQSANAQPAAQIKKTSTAPVIDGNVNDAVWANANVYDTDEFFIVEAAGSGNPIGPAAPSPDLTIEWRALWDNTNLYVMTKVNDDAMVNSLEAFGGADAAADWNDDSVEFYIDAQNVNNSEYDPNTNPGQPTFQFTALAGWTPSIADTDPSSPRPTRNPPSLPNTSFTHGINSYNGNDDSNQYPQTTGSATSSAVTTNPAGGFDWSFEASFPWEALEETPANILGTRGGVFGFGVAYNDDDDREGRDNQYMWATTLNDLWHASTSFPDVQLVEAATLPGDYNADGSVNAADYVLWRDNPGAFGGNPAGYNTWRTNFHRTAGAGSALGQAPTPEPATLLLFLMLLTAPWMLRRRRC